MEYVIDFETRSNVDLTKHGRRRYFTDPGAEADILMMSYRSHDMKRAEIWLPGQPTPAFMKDPNVVLVAHNAEFELDCINYIGSKYDFIPRTPKDFICTQSLAGRYGYPQSLQKLGDAMKLKKKKNYFGKELIKLFCTPEYGFGRDKQGKILPRYEHDWREFIQYCLDDTESEYEAYMSFPAQRLSDTERWVWEHTCHLNAEGLPIDIESVKVIRRLAEHYRDAHFELLPDITDGVITRITQTQRITKWVNEQLLADMDLSDIAEADLPTYIAGLKNQYRLMPNCQADTIEKMLEQDLPEKVMMVIEMRAALGLSSIGKYTKMEDMHVNGRIYDNMRYYGAHTGRWTGMGVQLLNLPRAAIEPAEGQTFDEAVAEEICMFHDGRIVDDGYNPVQSARALIRPMIKAEPGYVILAADYASIEYVLIEWFAGATHHVERFAQGFDQYVDQASAMYGIPFDLVTKLQRQSGKVVILGCGFGQGALKLVITAEKQWGMKIPFAEADFMVKGYRKTHKEVVKMWYACKDACIDAIQNPGCEFYTNKCKFKVVRDKHKRAWLTITLPSGRALYYSEPSIEEDTYGPIPCHWGFHKTSGMWLKMKLIPGRIVENIVQAAARDVLVHGLQQIERTMGNVVLWSVYDEVVCQVPDTDPEASLKQLCTAMCATEEWSKDIPLSAEGFYGQRYKKM